jgi:hypothetical protein
MLKTIVYQGFIVLNKYDQPIYNTKGRLSIYISKEFASDRVKRDKLKKVKRKIRNVTIIYE